MNIPCDIITHIFNYNDNFIIYSLVSKQYLYVYKNKRSDFIKWKKKMYFIRDPLLLRENINSVHYPSGYSNSSKGPGEGWAGQFMTMYYYRINTLERMCAYYRKIIKIAQNSDRMKFKFRHFLYADYYNKKYITYSSTESQLDNYLILHVKISLIANQKIEKKEIILDLCKLYHLDIHNLHHDAFLYCSGHSSCVDEKEVNKCNEKIFGTIV